MASSVASSAGGCPLSSYAPSSASLASSFGNLSHVQELRQKLQLARQQQQQAAAHSKLVASVTRSNPVATAAENAETAKLASSSSLWDKLASTLNPQGQAMVQSFRVACSSF